MRATLIRAPMADRFGSDESTLGRLPSGGSGRSGWRGRQGVGCCRARGNFKVVQVDI